MRKIFIKLKQLHSVIQYHSRLSPNLVLVAWPSLLLLVEIQSRDVSVSKILFIIQNPVNIYLFKVNNRNTRKKCKIRSKLTIKTPERREYLCESLFLSKAAGLRPFFMFHTFFSVFLLLNLNRICCWLDPVSCFLIKLRRRALEFQRCNVHSCMLNLGVYGTL